MTYAYRSPTDDELRQLFATLKTVAVLGIKTEGQATQPAFYVAKYLVDAGLDVIPVPVYYPDVTSILGRPVVRSLAAIDRPIDLVDVFRRPEDLEAHVEDLLAARPKVVWFQLGIRNDDVAARLASAGIDVIQDRCLMVDHGQLGGRSPSADR